jgi:hypothetical protein
MKKLIPFIFMIQLVLVIACDGGKSTDENVDVDSLQNVSSQNTGTDTSEVKFNTIFYELASPVELTQYAHKANPSYSYDMLNPVANKDKYHTNFKEALNLGIYGSDLSYARLYNQTQDAINFLSTISYLSKEMGIPGEKVARVLSRADKNIENADSLALIINEAYSNADNYLKNNEKESMAALIYFGSWIESMHISCSIYDNPETDRKFLGDHIAQQKYYLNSIFALMNNVQDSEEMSRFNALLKQLKRIYSDISILYEKGSVSIDTVKKSIQVSKDATVKYTPGQIKQIREIVMAIRAEIVN